jgi:lipopolysaccharide/colanic/teichoic acid biosynthesis glycosyltransferase
VAAFGDEVVSGRAYELTKRGLDVVLVAGVGIVTAPLLGAIAAAIKLETRGPLFFRQERIGRYGRPFEIVKFRTLVGQAPRNPGDFVISASDSRITRVGAFLRRWSLDEVPQLWNVLKGDMSIVGPRPTLRYQVDQYTDFQRRRLEVPPGVTGWAQVNGRNALNWPDRIELDVWYVDHRSLALDLKILVRTPRTLLQARSIYGDVQGDWGEREAGASERPS